MRNLRRDGMDKIKKAKANKRAAQHMLSFETRQVQLQMRAARAVLASPQPLKATCIFTAMYWVTTILWVAIAISLTQCNAG